MTELDPRRQRLLSAMGFTPWAARGRNAGGRSPSGVLEASAAQPAGESVADTGDGADSVTADDWARLEADIAACTRCPLHASRRMPVPGVGDRAARLLIVGEAPGAEEDRRGEPFVGPAGQLLDAMLAALGLNRQQGVYITNVIKSRPPDNRDPHVEEIAACQPWLERQIALIQPVVMLALGRVAAQALTGRNERIGQLRGRWHAYGATQIPLLATYHPAYLLREPAAKARVWADLLMLRQVLAPVAT